MTKKSYPRFRNSDVLRMFPAFVWKAELRPAASRPINRRAGQMLVKLGAPLVDLKFGESWQSDHGLHDRAELRTLVACIEEAAELVLDYLKIGHADFRITGCWTNVNAPGAGHRAHSHPNNYLSGVYYVQTPPGADAINFHDPRPQAGIIRPPHKELTPENTDQVTVKVTDGTLLLFPAWLQHSVDVNRSAGMRISISFNIMFSSFAEVMGRPGWEPGRRPVR